MICNNVSPTTIKSTSPSGKFLSEGGSFANIAVLPKQTGNAGKYLVTDGTSASWNFLGAGTISGMFQFTSGNGIDAVGTSGSDVLTIGASNANVINYGNASTIHNFYGTTIYENMTNSYVKDKLITLNSGGAASSGSGVGFEVEEASGITGFFRTSADRQGFSFKSPANSYLATFNTTGLSADRTYTLPNASGTFLLGSALSDYAIAYGSGGSLTGSGNFAWTGSVLKVNGKSFLGGTTDPTAYLDVAASTSTAASLRLRSGTKPAIDSVNSGDIWYSASSGFGFQIETRATSFLKVSTGNNGIYFAQSPSSSNAALYGNDTDTALNASSLTNLQVGGTTKFSASSSGLTAYAGLTFMAGSGTAGVPIKMQTGTLVTTPVGGAIEFASGRLYFSPADGSRQTVAFTTDITGASPGGATKNIQFNNGSSFGGSDRFTWDKDTQYFKVNGSSMFGLDPSIDPGAIVDIGSASDKASLRIRSTGGATPTTLNDGDMWFTGSFLFIRIGGSNKRVTVG